MMRPSDLATDLLRHEDFLRRLARGLVGADGDDLVQDVWERALRQPPRPIALRAWLARAARGLAANRHRAAANRAAREDAVRRSAADERSPGALEERFERQRGVAAALDALREPFRGTLLLRYLEDLSIEEVAARQRVPLATARSRHRRGLEQLRRVLDARGGREAWLAALVPWLFPDAPPRGTDPHARPGRTASTAATLAPGSTPVTALVLAALVGGLAWLWASVPGEPDAVSGAPRATVSVGRTEARASDTRLADAGTPRRAVAMSSPAAASTGTRVEGVARDDQARPLREYTLVAAAHSWLSNFDPAAPASETRRRDVRDPTGAFAIDLPDGQWDLVAELPDGRRTFPVLVEVPRDRGPVELLLVREAALAGTVVDPRGRPVAGARVEVPLGGLVAEDPLVATTDATGRFELEHVPPGSRSLWASAEGWGRGPTLSLEVAPAEVRDGLVLELVAQGRLVVRVLDPQGLPDVGRPGWVIGPRTTRFVADEDGRAEIELLAGSYHVGTDLRDDERLREGLDPRLTDEDVRRARTVSGAVDVVAGQGASIVLGGPPVARLPVAGRVVHAGAGVEDAKVCLERDTAFTDASGRFALTGETAGRARLLVETGNVAIPFEREVSGAGRLDLELAVGSAMVTGRLLSSEGEPLARSIVHMSVTPLPEDPADAVRGYATTGADGTFAFHSVPAGTYTLDAGRFPAAPRWPWAPVHVVVVVPDAGTVTQDLVLPLAGHLSVTVRDPAGRLVPGAGVVLFDEAGRRESRRVSRYGTALFDALVPGAFHVAAYDGTRASTLAGPIEVRAGEALDHELVLQEATLLRVTLVDADGQPLGGQVDVFDAAHRLRGNLWIQDEAFELPLPPGRYTVRARPGDGRERSTEVRLRAQAEERVELVVGEL